MREGREKVEGREMGWKVGEERKGKRKEREKKRERQEGR